MEIKLNKINAPDIDNNSQQVILPNSVYENRKEKLISRMLNQNVDTVIIYADREHSSNFEYFTGFVPRFEEAILIIHNDGVSYLILGNENMKMAKHSRINCEAIKASILSLPNQPMEKDESLSNIFKEAQISSDKKIGIIGWKLIKTNEDNENIFDVPYFIVDAIKHLTSNIFNYTDVLISPHDGIRTINTVDELAYLEYGSTLAGKNILNTMDVISLDKRETDLANTLAYGGQPNTVTTVCAVGERFTNAIVYPRDKQIELGDKISITVGYKGGLSSRAGYVVDTEEDLNTTEKNYLEDLAFPYYKALVTWLENAKIGTNCNYFYNLINTVFPKENYGWELNPGHLTATEEWLSSPFYLDSNDTIKSGQIYQIDIIPSVEGYGGVSCEDGVAIADKELREKIHKHYPSLWERFNKRRNYIINELGINLPEEVLPMNDIVAYYRPFLLDKTRAFSLK